MTKIIFIDNNDVKKEVEAENGMTILEVARQNGVDLEGACEGSLACSTCHVIVDPSYFGKLSAASEDEEDILDLAFGLTKTSRLGCQIYVSDDLEGLVLRLPNGSRNL